MSLRHILLPVATAVGVCVSLASCGTPSSTGDTGRECPGTCAPAAPSESGWKGPALLWSGPKEKAPACPTYAPEILYQGNAELVAPNACAACACGPPSGSCALPTEMTTYNSEIACMPSQYVFHCDPPPNWDGSCVKGSNVIPANTFNTFINGPLHLTESGCSPGVAVPAVTAPPPSWGTYGLACTGQGSPCKSGDFCFPPKDPIPEGFGLCILHDGVEQCPKAYPNQHVFYDGFDDGRACSPCACGSPTGSDCLAWIRIYQDTTCKDALLSRNVGLTPSTWCQLNPGPFPPPFPWSLGSMTAEPPKYTPGTCPTMGGEPIGAAVEKGPSTFCCLD